MILAEFINNSINVSHGQLKVMKKLMEIDKFIGNYSNLKKKYSMFRIRAPDYIKPDEYEKYNYLTAPKKTVIKSMKPSLFGAKREIRKAKGRRNEN